jgi:hypothetical protein
MSTIDVGAGMRSADIPDGWGHLPDVGTCPVCRARGRLKKDSTMRQHWRYGWPRRGGNPPCPGTGQKPAVLNGGRVTRYLAQQRDAAQSATTNSEAPMSDTIPQTVDEITPTDIKRITGWIGRHALPSTLPDTMPEYRTALALDAVVTSLASRLTAHLPLLYTGQAHRDAVRDDWNLLVAAARTWSTEPEYPGWQAVGDTQTANRAAEK